ncbi:patatin-like phospholipase family protein [Komagataeibacter europaeus]|uniref:patatin-like phospholipase family protein n=1 Tax=Komagataeibacter europaeus TaxID=33995 RepID=UPI000B566AB1|nr:patatin-like phospholipase family protein [Komagataeibacter europaeus]ARW16874.1 hypothetical protein S101446_01748 [Komagataeibacter europaeus]
MKIFSAVTWTKKLKPFQDTQPSLFGPEVLRRFGGAEWAPGPEDRAAAALLHIQLVSRVATQSLRYSVGTERAALESLHALFERCRAISERYPGASLFETLAWSVLNGHVRPFTARWHRRAASRRLDAVDDGDDFRLELARLQTVLLRFDQLLLELRDGVTPIVGEDPLDDPVRVEMMRDLPWGLQEGDPDRLAGVTGSTPEQIADDERDAVERRRRHYGLNPGTNRATGLALSGGGIRSATFALGVLSALSRRGLLKQFDYMSTVSGGGYLGAFVTQYLHGSGVEKAAPADDRGAGLGANSSPFGSLDRDSPAIGHIRQNCRYLASGPKMEKWRVATAQLAGLVNNLLSLAALAALLAYGTGVVFNAFTDYFGVDGWSAAFKATGALAALAVFAVPVAAVFWKRSSEFSDSLLFWCVVPLFGILAAKLLTAIVSLYHSMMADDYKWMALAILSPLSILIVGVMLSRMSPRIRWLGAAIARSSAPLFVLAAFLTFLELGRRSAMKPTIFLSWVVVALIMSIFISVNYTGLHRHYRRRLAETFLIKNGATPGTIEKAVPARLSDLATDSMGPYPIFNAALNVPASERPAMRGRLTDFFSFTPHRCGSPITGYRATTEWEKKDKALDLATAMAISGAAISPRMGLVSLPQFSFWLALLNVRLDYWLRDADPSKKSWLWFPWLRYLLHELTGRMDERAPYLNLSDGGHIENLGIYELLRRRCKFIVAVDGEQDPEMTFHGFANLQRLASIDLGVQIDMDLDDLRLDDAGLSRSHFQFCRIRYPDYRTGYLCYVKLSLTGNEGEFLRRFRMDEPSFPHHPTADQNFSEARFEAYRSLGQHVGEKLFLESIIGEMARQPEMDLDDWFYALGTSLLEPAIDAEESVGVTAPASA